MESEEDTVMDNLQETTGKWKKWTRKRLPITVWLPKYDKLTALSDLVAGITLGLTLVPQSIAYASLASLPVHYGLYSAFMGEYFTIFKFKNEKQCMYILTCIILN